MPQETETVWRTVYWAAIREQDGDWSEYREVSRERYEKLSQRSDFCTTTTRERVTDGRK